MGRPYLGHGLHVLPTLRFEHELRYCDDVTARGGRMQNADAVLLAQCCQKHYKSAILMRTLRHSSGYPPDYVISMHTEHALTRKCRCLLGSQQVPTFYRSIKFVILYWATLIQFISCISLKSIFIFFANLQRRPTVFKYKFLKLYNPVVIIRTTRFNTQFYILPTQFAFCVDLITNRDYFAIQH